MSEQSSVNPILVDEPLLPPLPCIICGGEKTYPVYALDGIQLYSIRCPHCRGSGMEDPQ